MSAQPSEEAGPASHEPAPAWTHQQERSNLWTLRLMRWIALTTGRPVARLLLHPISLYFFVMGGAARRESAWRTWFANGTAGFKRVVPDAGLGGDAIRPKGSLALFSNVRPLASPRSRHACLARDRFTPAARSSPARSSLARSCSLPRSAPPRTRRGAPTTSS